MWLADELHPGEQGVEAGLDQRQALGRDGVIVVVPRVLQAHGDLRLPSRLQRSMYRRQPRHKEDLWARRSTAPSLRGSFSMSAMRSSATTRRKAPSCAS